MRQAKTRRSAAEPSANAFAQGEKEQGIAEPAVTEQASTAVTEQVEDGKMQNVQEEDGEALQNEQTPGGRGTDLRGARRDCRGAA